MAQSTSKLLIFFICINIALYIGGFRVIHDDFLDNFFSYDKGAEELILTDGSEDLRTATPTDLSVASAEESTSGWKLTDVFRTLWGFISFLINTIFMPLAFFTDTSLGLPWPIKVLFGGPLTVAYLLAVISWFKGQD